MKNILKLFLIALIFISVLSCATVNRADGAAAEETVTEVTPVEDTMQITGRVVIFGNEPFIYAGIVSEDGTQYAIYPQETEAELRGLQGRLLVFTVIFSDEQVYGSQFLKGGTVRPVEWEVADSN